MGKTFTTCNCADKTVVRREKRVTTFFGAVMGCHAHARPKKKREPKGGQKSQRSQRSQRSQKSQKSQRSQKSKWRSHDASAAVGGVGRCWLLAWSVRHYSSFLTKPHIGLSSASSPTRNPSPRSPEVVIALTRSRRPPRQKPSSPSPEIHPLSSASLQGRVLVASAPPSKENGQALRAWGRICTDRVDRADSSARMGSDG